MNKTALSAIAALTVAASVSAIVVSRRAKRNDVQEVDEKEQAEMKRRERNAARKAMAEKATRERKAAEARASVIEGKATVVPVDKKDRSDATARSNTAAQQEAARKTLQAMSFQGLDAADSVMKRENEATNASVERLGKSRKEAFQMKSIQVDSGSGRGTPNTSFSDYDSAIEEHEEVET